MDSRAEIRADRLSIRPIGQVEPESLHHYLIENRKAHAPWEPIRPESHFSLSHGRERFESGEIEKAAERRFALGLHGAREIVGLINFTNIVGYPFLACHLGFSIAATHEGKGFMREGLQATIGRLFGELELNRVMASFLPRNFRSARLLSSLGFRVEGFAKDYLLIAGKWEDHILTSLSRRDWASASASRAELAAGRERDTETFTDARPRSEPPSAR